MKRQKLTVYVERCEPKETSISKLTEGFLSPNIFVSLVIS